MNTSNTTINGGMNGNTTINGYEIDFVWDLQINDDYVGTGFDEFNVDGIEQNDEGDYPEIYYDLQNKLDEILRNKF